MHKQLRIITHRHMAVCSFSRSMFPPVPLLPAFVFGRHLGRRRIHFQYSGTRVFALGRTGWFVHCLPSGRRWLCCLPF